MNVNGYNSFLSENVYGCMNIALYQGLRTTWLLVGSQELEQLLLSVEKFNTFLFVFCAGIDFPRRDSKLIFWGINSRKFRISFAKSQNFLRQKILPFLYNCFTYTLCKTCLNTGFLWPVYFRISTKSTLLSFNRNIQLRENQYTGISYAVPY